MNRFCSLALVLLVACGDGGGTDETPLDGPAYVLGTLVFGPEGTASYVSVLDGLGSSTVDLKQAREFPSAADVWVHGGKVFVTNPEALTLTRYRLEGHALAEEATISFASYGLTSFGFWLNSFVADDKAYLLNGAAEFIVWNPETMEITGTIALPSFEARPGFKLFPGYSDRSARVRNGRLYQPLYWTDETYFQYTPDSRIVVVDIATDKVVETIEAPCPGLDYASADGAGNLYFSSWFYAPGAAVVLHQPSTCAFEFPADGSAPHVAFRFADIAGGREGGVLRFLPGEGALFSAFHDERFTVDGIFDLGRDGTATTQAFESPGWSVRLFRAR